MTLAMLLVFKATLVLLVALVLDAALQRWHVLACASMWNAALAVLLLFPLAALLPPLEVPLLGERIKPAEADLPAEFMTTPSGGSWAERAHLAFRPESDAPRLPTDSTQAPAGDRTPAPQLSAGPAAGERFWHSSAPWYAAVTVWLAGLVAVAFRLATSWLAVSRLRRRSTAVECRDWQARLAQWQRQIGCRPAVLRQSDQIDVPLVVGYFRPVILIPSSLVGGLKGRSRDAVLVHELAHVARGDYAWQLVLRVLQAALWFHPLIWLAERRIAFIRERACDDFTVHALDGDQDYAETLLAIAGRLVQRSEFGLGLAMLREPRLAARLDAIADSPGNPRCRLSRPGRLLAFSLALAFAGTLGSVTIIHAQRVKTPSSAVSTEDAAPKSDNSGAPLPPGAVLRLGTKRLQSKGSFAWTPDGKTLITLRGGTLYFWDMADGHLQKTLVAPVSNDTFYTYASQFVLSRDGKRLVCTDFYGAIGVWDLEKDQLRARLPVSDRGHEEHLALALLPDGNSFVTVRHTGELQIWSTERCELLKTIRLPAGNFTARPPIALSPDGKLVAIGNQSSAIYVIDLERRGEPAVIARPHGEWLCDVQFISDKQLISVGAKKRDAAVGGSALWKNELRFWDVDGLKPGPEWPFDDSLPACCDVAFSPDRRTMVSVHRDRIVEWDAARRTVTRVIDGLSFYNAGETRVAIDPSGTFVAVDDRTNYVRIWNLVTGKPHLSTDQHPQGRITAIAWHPDSRTLATGDSRGELFMWNTMDGNVLRKTRGPHWGIFAIDYFENGKQLVLCGDVSNRGGMTEALGPVRWHYAGSGRLERERIFPGRARLIMVSPDQTFIAVAVGAGDALGGGKSSIVVLDAETGDEQSKIETDSIWPVAMSWSADGQVVSVAEREKVVQVEARTGKVLSEVELPHQRRNRHTALLEPSEMVRAAFSRDGKVIVTSGGLPEIYGWTVATGEKRWTIQVATESIAGLALSADESVVACIASEGDKGMKKLHLFDTVSQRELAHFDVEPTGCRHMAFSPDGSRIALGFDDGTLLVYHVTAAAAKLEPVK